MPESPGRARRPAQLAVAEDPIVWNRSDVRRDRVASGPHTSTWVERVGPDGGTPHVPAANREEEVDGVPARTVAAVLDLLLDAPAHGPDDLQLLLDEALVSPAAARAIAVRVERIRAHLSRAQRRRDELAALFASSRELAEQREFEPLLRRLVGRANDLLCADLTWLAEIDPLSGELVVRTATGTISAELEGVRVPAGHGLAWHVATYRRPYSTTRYHGDKGFPHDPGADGALMAEGVVSALGVPLIAGDDVIGTLFVATRTEMDFHPDQVALLTAFADHGAVILQGARLLAQARTLAREADESRRELAHHVDAMEAAYSDHAELTECVLRGENAEQVASTLARALTRDVMILDETSAPTSGSLVRFTVEGCWRHPDITAAIAQSRRTGRFVPTSCPGVSGAVAVVAGGTLLGALLVARSISRLSSVQHKTIEDAARIMALLRLKQDALAEAEERVGRELLSDLVDCGSHGMEEIRLRAHSRGIALDDITRIFVVSVAERRQEALRAVQSAVPRPVLVGEHAGALVVAFRRSEPIDAHTIWQKVRARLDLPVLVVEASRAATCDAVPARYREARRCLSLLPELGVTDGTVKAAAYALYTHLFEPNGQEIDAFVEATIGPLVESDEARGTDLIQTVSTFTECNASTTRTARTLHLHPNTVVQRLERVAKLLGGEWREPDMFFRVQVAVRVHGIRQRGAAGT